MEIKRKCSICGALFIAKTLDSRTCSKKCAEKLKNKRRAEKIRQERLVQIAESVPDTRDYISVSEAVAMFGISRDTIYRYIRKGAIPYINIGERLTRISKSELMKFFPKRETPIEQDKPLPKLYSLEPEDCYTIGEICKKYNINDSSVWAHVRKYSIPTRQIGNYVYVPKSEIDNLYKSDV